MRRLPVIKMLAFGALGYLVYQFYEGLVHGPSVQPPRRDARGRSAHSRDLERALNEDAGRMNVTGTGRGTVVSTEDASGMSGHHVVGRGVVRS